VLRPGIVHRLDRGTSGVLVAAKEDRTHQGLAEQFHDHSILREYCAFVRGVPGADHGRVDRPIGRHPRDRKRMSVRTHVGRAAITEWDIAARFPRSAVSRLAVHPQTGRTHQIRVHLASVGTPIVGDPLYGRARRKQGAADLDRPALHAALLGFVHPQTGEHMRFTAPLPDDMASLELRLKSREGIA
jgi:23S rRNA pseudouridine1911/1915/1917 synthase